MNNNENNQNQNNYVTPTQVDLSKVTVDNSDTTLNRERDNIVSASIQANRAIDEKQATTVNNSIKVKKRNPIISALIGIFFVGVAGGLTFLGYRLIDDYIKTDDAKYTTTTTTTTKVNHFHEYLFDNTKLRKFQNEKTILILLPTLANNNQRYFYLNISDSGIIYQEEGTYNIVNNVVGLTSSANGYKTFVVTEEDLSADQIALDMFDSEVKYYISKSNEIDCILVVNGTSLNEIAYFYNGNSGNLVKHTETAESITLENGAIFIKNGTDLSYNGVIYNYVN